MFCVFCTVDWVLDPNSATHILTDKVVQEEEKLKKEEAFRTVATDGPKALLHFCGYPASYDRWVSNRPGLDFASFRKEPWNQSSPQKFEISLSWLEKSALYNELLDESDFTSPSAVALAPQALEQPIPPIQAGVKRPPPDEIDASEGSSHKRSHLEASPQTEAQQDFAGNQVMPDLSLSADPTTAPPAPSTPPAPSAPPALPTASQPFNSSAAPTLPASSVPSVPSVPPPPPAPTPATSSTRHNIQVSKDQEDGSLTSSGTFVMPVQSAWFSLHRIHPIERHALPEFFTGKNRSKTADIYRQYRDFMVNTYRLNPLEYLSFTACRRNLKGDVCALLRIHKFLDQWGVINHQSLPDTRPQPLGPPFTGHFRVTVDAARGLGSVHAQPRRESASVRDPTPRLGTDAESFTKGVNLDALTASASSHHRTFANASEGTSSSSPAPTQPRPMPVRPSDYYTCDTCGVDCTQVRYRLLRPSPSQTDNAWCPLCYEAGRIPAPIGRGDLIKTETDPTNPLDGGSTQGSHVVSTDWSDAETLLLLRAIQANGTNWDAVSNAVGTRTAHECALRFTTMPVQDRYLTEPLGGRLSEDASDKWGAGTRHPVLGPYSLTGESRFAAPFNQTDNPILSVLAVLSSLVQPEVVQHATKRALLALDLLVSKDSKCREKGATQKARDVHENHIDGQPQRKEDAHKSQGDKDEEQRSRAPEQAAPNAPPDSVKTSDVPMNDPKLPEPSTNGPSSEPEAGKASSQSGQQPEVPSTAQTETRDGGEPTDEIQLRRNAEIPSSESATRETESPAKGDTARPEAEKLAAQADDHWAHMHVRLTAEELRTQANLGEVVGKHVQRYVSFMRQFDEFEARLVEQRQRLSQRRSELYSDRLTTQSQLHQLADLIRQHASHIDEVSREQEQDHEQPPGLIYAEGGPAQPPERLQEQLFDSHLRVQSDGQPQTNEKPVEQVPSFLQEQSQQPHQEEAPEQLPGNPPGQPPGQAQGHPPNQSGELLVSQVQ